MGMISNDCAYLDFYKQSLKGRVQDYVISFYDNPNDFDAVLMRTSTLFQRLIETFSNKRISARLVAKVNFEHINNISGNTEERSYHFPSYSNEDVIDPYDFFVRHLQKIVSRLDTFNSSGSNLLLKNIEHIHIHLTFCL